MSGRSDFDEKNNVRSRSTQHLSAVVVFLGFCMSVPSTPSARLGAHAMLTGAMTKENADLV